MSAKARLSWGGEMSSAVVSSRLGVAIALVAMLACAVLGGLLRAGSLPPLPYGSQLVGQAAGLHAVLMLSSFLGSVIAVERAVALRRPWAYAAALLSVAQGLAAGHRWSGGVLVRACSGGAGVAVLRAGQWPAAGAPAGGAYGVDGDRFLAWLGGNLAYAWQREASVALLWWFAFVVLTITAERLEMSRLLPRHPVSRPLLLSAVLCLLAALLAALADLRTGLLLFGIALLVLAGWLCCFDVARRTVCIRGPESLHGGMPVEWLWLAGGVGPGLGRRWG
jgi:hypothetical protein